MKRLSLVLFTAAIAVLLGAIYFATPGHAPAGQPALVEINSSNLASLESEFNRTFGQVRVVLLLSPT